MPCSSACPGRRFASRANRSAAIGPGLLILLGVGQADDEFVAAGLAAKVAGLRIFADAEGLTNLSLGEVGGAALVVSQFTLYADSRRGRRPVLRRARPGRSSASASTRSSARSWRSQNVPVRQGGFGAHMDVELVNDGPFTVWLDSDELGLEPRPAA